MKLSVMVTMMLLFSCAAMRTKPAEPWSIRVTSSGGIAGKGAGTFSIDSAGEIGVTTMMGKSCSFRATAAELDRFRELLAKAKPDSWKESYVPENACCDRFEYEMTIDEAGTKYTVRWIDLPEEMPKDLLALTNAMMGPEPSLRASYGGKCQ